ncbi:Phosphoglycerate mutase [Xylanimonas cellulosilytica DSM 15894]|uniref:Phosphoglycerate mutase n=1 Tax=Xylanimonas cellulosilytica (strain DSM 15894 / JCM 12276 / CECT 5975 / KCTC 9989 / LMG 20990 / NBRC 107835 / XIL07) TaxID=446471 RepID=D1BU88_XYLCX|nr:bifunctional RNase H/acid phosphatase [Xylanimonas cellulosilytica]ACZ31101.1 Phosphoglycerate mutase [Xylanimonas cellulosilytica DSM 15894]
MVAGVGRELVVEADGGSRGNPGPAGYGALVRDVATGSVLAERAGYLGVATNNVAEYTGLLEGLRAAAGIDPAARVHVRLDSRLVVEQMSGRWQIKHDALRAIAAQARAVLPAAQVTYEWIPRASNAAADALANEAMDSREPRIARDFPGSDATLPADTTVHAVAEPGETMGAPQDLEPLTAAAAPAHREPRWLPAGAFSSLDPAEALTLVLVRHGVTPLTLVGSLSGGEVPGPPLTAQGRVQAARAADAVYRMHETWHDLPRPSHVVSSPMVRTRELAGAIGRRLGLTVEVDDRLREMEFGQWESLTPAQVEERWPGDFARWFSEGTFAPPGGESYVQVGERVAAVVDDLRAAGTGRTVVVAGHAAMIRTFVGRALAMPPSSWASLRIPPCSLTILRYFPTTTEVVTVGYPT